MAILKTDSPLARRIALSILHFLHSVEPASGVDQEGLEVAKECLSEAFKINLSSIATIPTCESLVDMFSSREQMSGLGNQGAIFHGDGLQGDLPCANPGGNVAESNVSKSQVDGCTREDHTFGTSKDELFGKYFSALETIHYFSLPDGNDDQGRLDRATDIFYKALEEMQRSGCGAFDQRNLAEALKIQGNKAMQLKLYSDAIELYTFAIALCGDNAVYYCNRAAAYTKIEYYQEAIKDSMKSIEIDPNYSKAYSRLGLAYYSQGKYRDAIDKGFIKALQLDPNNNTVKENIRAAEQKLREAQQRRGQNQGSTSTNSRFTAGSRSYSIPPQFNFQVPAMNTSELPSDMANMFRNVASTVSPGENDQSGHEESTVDMASMFRNMATNPAQGQSFRNGSNGTAPNVPNDPEVGLGGGININFADGMPEDLSGAMRSVREMFASGAPQGNPEDNVRGRQEPR